MLFEQPVIVRSLRLNAEKVPTGYTKIHVDRKTIFGNHGNAVGQNVTRDQAIAAFQERLDKAEQANDLLWQSVVELANKVKAGEKLALMCWCYPERCHADIIKEAIYRINESA